MAHKRSGNLRILVVDDEKTLVKGMKFNLENEGYEVECAYDGAAAPRKRQRPSHRTSTQAWLSSQWDQRGA